MSFRDWIEEARLYLRTKDGTENGVFLRRISIIGTNRPLPGCCPAAIGVRENRELAILFCYPLVGHLPPAPAAELLKHELLHYVFGHLSERIQELRKIFGDYVVLVAMDLVVNQFCDERLLAKHGLPGKTIEEFDFAPNLTTKEYCALLVEKEPNTGRRKIDKMDARSAGAFGEAAEEFEGDIDDLIEGQEGEAPKGHGCLTEVFTHSKKLEPEARDELIIRTIERARQDAKEAGLARGRGWDAGEALEYIERYRRPPSVQWQVYLHRMESRHMNVRRVSSRRRPSRRHPSYFGRVKRSGAEMWFGVDTSGSMGENELKLVDPELRAISQRDVHITIAHVDAGLAKLEEYSAHKGLVEFAGRGGTDFSPLFFELDKMPPGVRPSFLVYFTDGFGCCTHYLKQVKAEYDPEKPRPLRHPGGVETLWLLPEDCRDKDDFMEAVPFGNVITVPAVKGEE